jgi:predicted nucleic acid-binding Zn ribbon protein
VSTEEPDEQRSEGEAAEDWKPTGLELARAVAKSVAAAAGTNTRRVGWRRGGGNGRSSRTGSRPGKASGARPDDRDPQLLEATLDRLVSERGWTTDVAVAGAIARWDHIVGPEMAAHCKAERYADAELTVRADSTAWATQVRLLAATLVKRLNDELGDGTVKKVNVLGPTAPSWRKGPRSVRDGRGPRDTYG